MPLSIYFLDIRPPSQPENELPNILQTAISISAVALRVRLAPLSVR